MLEINAASAVRHAVQEIIVPCQHLHKHLTSNFTTRNTRLNPAAKVMPDNIKLHVTLASGTGSGTCG